VWESMQQRARSRAFSFTESEDETDEEEMVAVPRAYLERLELANV
jgi:hypothetical protein